MTDAIFSFSAISAAREVIRGKKPSGRTFARDPWTGKYYDIAKRTRDLEKFLGQDNSTRTIPDGVVVLTPEQRKAEKLRQAGIKDVPDYNYMYGMIIPIGLHDIRTHTHATFEPCPESDPELSGYSQLTHDPE